MQRVQKILAGAGVASRRNAEELIKQGKVFVNGKQAKIGQSADPDNDNITVNGKQIKTEKFVYILLNKPKNVMTAVSDPEGRTTVRDLVDVEERVFPVGRLDKDVTGLVLLTNDGQLANRMMHPRYETKKFYLVKLSVNVTPELLQKLRNGVMVEGRRVELRDIKQIGRNHIQLSLHEGRKYIVKKIFVKLGTHANELTRMSIGPLEIGKLKEGRYRRLSEKEVSGLRRALKLSK